ncbi:aldehyde dehydrogenase family protein [Nocardia sp. NPDC051750]|uniref:aldehyde dehydrogenase family protein n=1 Tax=Nocardia sp. NPDC051750 TaxID=3364325 RepID=UPI0037A032A6
MDVASSFIDGCSVVSADTYDIVDPSTSQPLGAASRGGADEVDRAVRAARKALATWRRTPPAERATVLGRIAEAIDAQHEQLARYECQDTGKPLSQARADITVSARYFRFYAHAIDTYYGHSIPLADDLHVYTRREPLGVVGHILAWNYPMQLLSRAVAPAIATGNVVVAKPADETPRTAVALAELAFDCGLPAGVLNIVTGIGAEAGAALAAHPGVDSIGFVGSTRVGSEIAHAAADRVVPAVLELGGKSPQIVFGDADLDTAADTVAKAILQNAGQTCSAGSRLLVEASVHDAVVAKVLHRFSGVRLGRGLDDPDLGPLISRTQQTRVTSMLSEVTQGEILCGGGPPNVPGLSDGAFFAPTLIDGVDPTAPIAQDEIFGPVLTVNTFTEEQEALALANGTDYALLAAVWTRDLSRAHRLAADIVAGQVYVNTYGAGGGVELPFGGFRKSGYGREKGLDALDAMTATKTVVIKL